MMKTIILLLLSFVLANCSSAPKPVIPATPHALIDPNTVDVLQILPGPPKLHSKASDADYETLKHLQKTRTKEQCERAKSEESFTSEGFIGFFQVPRGPLSEAETNHWKPFFSRLLADSRPIWRAGKEHWARPRPYYVVKSLHPCVKVETNYAYPSGHAATGELYAKVLADIYPERAEAFLKRGIEIGDDRVLGGVHHPTDVRDGRVLGDHVYDAFQKNEYFKAALKLMR